MDHGSILAAFISGLTYHEGWSWHQISPEARLLVSYLPLRRTVLTG